MFITFEGIDCSGKTTQAKLLVERLLTEGCGRGEVLFLREPGGTPVSEKIRAILLDRSHPELIQTTELFLFSAARAQLVAQVITPAVARGVIVICDRFYDSTTAYQGYGRGLNLEDVRAVNRIAAGTAIPDLTLFIDIEVEEVFRRRSTGGLTADRMESAGKAFFTSVRKGYLALAEERPGSFLVLDGMRPIGDIHRDIYGIVQARLTNKRSTV